MKTFPIPRRLPCPPVHHQLFRPLRHFRVQVVQEHPQRRLLLPPLARNLCPPRRPKRPLRQACFFHCSWHSHAHEFPSPPLILAHATPFCTSSHSSVDCQFPKTPSFGHTSRRVTARTTSASWGSASSNSLARCGCLSAGGITANTLTR